MKIAVATLADASTEETQLALLGGVRLIPAPGPRVRPFVRIMGGWARVTAPLTIVRRPDATITNEARIASIVSSYIDRDSGWAIAADAGVRIDLSSRVFVNAAVGWQFSPALAPPDGRILGSPETASRNQLRACVCLGWEIGR